MKPIFTRYIRESYIKSKINVIVKIWGRINITRGVEKE
jgi:hypothetical protein